MPLHRTAPARHSGTGRAGPRFSVPRGLLTGTAAAAALVWGQYALLHGSRLSALVQTGIDEQANRWLAESRSRIVVEKLPEQPEGVATP